MPNPITEKGIRARLAEGQERFGDNSIRHLLAIIDEQRGTIAMHEANADEAALKAARREAKIVKLSDYRIEYEKEITEWICKKILENDPVGLYLGVAGGDFPSRLQIELRNLRAQVAEAHAAGHPVNLFETLANAMKENWRWKRGGGVVR